MGSRNSSYPRFPVKDLFHKEMLLTAGLPPFSKQKPIQIWQLKLLMNFLGKILMVGVHVNSGAGSTTCSWERSSAMQYRGGVPQGTKLHSVHPDLPQQLGLVSLKLPWLPSAQGQEDRGWAGPKWNSHNRKDPSACPLETPQDPPEQFIWSKAAPNTAFAKCCSATSLMSGSSWHAGNNSTVMRQC